MPYLLFQTVTDKQCAKLNKDAEFAIGRCRTNDISFGDDPKISRNHCIIYFYPDTENFAIRDLDSTNGTFLNGSRISSDLILSDQDEITVGNISIKYVEKLVTDSQKRAKKIAAPVASFGMDDLKDKNMTQVMPVVQPTFNVEVDSNDALKLKNGDIVQGYRIVRKYSETPLASSYLVRSTDKTEFQGLGQKLVLLKIFHKNFAEDDHIRKYFIDELKEASQFDHPSFTRYVEAGSFEGHCFYVVQFALNGNLGAKIAHHAPLPETEVLDFMRTIGEALHYSYERFDIIHGNLKPSNILIGARKQYLIGDLGMTEWYSLFLGKGSPAASPWYISPEQIADKSITWATDLYSLGIISFQMLAGSLPFHSTDEKKLLQMHIELPFPELEDCNPNIRVTDETRSILGMMTNKNPAKRFSSWDAFVNASEQAFHKAKEFSHKVKPFAPEKSGKNLDINASTVKENVAKKKLSLRKRKK